MPLGRSAERVPLPWLGRTLSALPEPALGALLESVEEGLRSLELLPESPDVPDVPLPEEPAEPEVSEELVEPLVEPRSELVLLPALEASPLVAPACWAESVEEEDDCWVCWSCCWVCDEADGSAVAGELVPWSA